jgi:hypothetical protein
MIDRDTQEKLYNSLREALRQFKETQQRAERRDRPFGDGKDWCNCQYARSVHAGKMRKVRK